MNDHSQLFRLLALLLDYPRAELREESLGLHALIRTCELPEALRDGLAALLNELCQGDLLDVQARYDGLFERGRSVSLLLFEHVHGESRDRGQAMVDLLDRYTGAGLQIDVPELPDYLPLYLEYLSLLPFAAASEGLAEVAHILGLLALVLLPLQSPLGMGLVVAWLGFFGFGWYGPWVAYVADTAPVGKTGFALGLAMAINQLAIVLAPPALGLLKDFSHSFVPGWLALCLMAAVALVVTAWSGRGLPTALPQKH
ncbi:nitrate reductase molybdenum cofactor assembly chaperone [Pseudomonas aeruginosa]|nr:nitrate reductase molybdenum cofactor assembly chaperone [Pseudomonas aeruginosa]MBF3213013.1 nitrate reductase molybdenum cofactor assembly chaperone [Pseudomonas aeruginosa]MBF3259494.1 nitrate reductase molybdenum cofactor assembly chaperone [Pseudomonas aeruginosa]MBF3287893.1 nitrate reductase molybdenum cofactor assembly chaperone [Pseudomonas aeruginosa]